jgi:hypothetical protein
MFGLRRFRFRSPERDRDASNPAREDAKVRDVTPRAGEGSRARAGLPR